MRRKQSSLTPTPKKMHSKSPSRQNSDGLSGDSDAGYESSSSDSYQDQKVKMPSQGSERRKADKSLRASPPKKGESAITRRKSLLVDPAFRSQTSLAMSQEELKKVKAEKLLKNLGSSVHNACADG